MQETRVQIVGTIPLSDFTSLTAFAEQRGIVHKATGQANVCRALREVVAAGLRTLDAELKGGNDDKR